MQLTKIVPLDGALLAAGEAFETHGLDDFRDWAEDRDLFDHPGLPLAAARTFADQAPATAGGSAWSAAVRTAADRTEADAWRPFDEIRYTEAERGTLASLHAFADQVEAASPLLGPVAGAVRLHAGADTTLGGVLDRRAGFTDDHLVVTRWSNSRATHEPALLAHVEAILPGFTGRLRELLAELDAELPDVAGHDNGAARLRRPGQATG